MRRAWLLALLVVAVAGVTILLLVLPTLVPARLAALSLAP